MLYDWIGSTTKRFFTTNMATAVEYMKKRAEERKMKYKKKRIRAVSVAQLLWSVYAFRICRWWMRLCAREHECPWTAAVYGDSHTDTHTRACIPNSFWQLFVGILNWLCVCDMCILFDMFFPSLTLLSLRSYFFSCCCCRCCRCWWRSIHIFFCLFKQVP